MNDTVTIRGNVGGDPVKSTTAGGVPVVHFRVASSSGYWDRSTGSWVEGPTNWYAVSAFRQLAEHAKTSLRSGDAVIVTGTLKLREWESNGKRGFSADLTADAVGHDLRWGTSNFMRTPRTSVPAPPPADAQTSAPDDGAPGEQPPMDDASHEQTPDWEAAGLHLMDGGEGAEQEQAEDEALAEV